MAETIYNQQNSKGKCTLVGNWLEERALRETTGVGRTIMKEHIPKKHLNFDEPIKSTKNFDNTHARVHGQKQEELMITENKLYGTGKNQADQLAKVGKRTQLIENQIYEQVLQEMKEREQELERQRNARYFDSTNKATFVAKDLCENTIGRKVMKTQNGELIPFENINTALFEKKNLCLNQTKNSNNFGNSNEFTQPLNQIQIVQGQTGTGKSVSFSNLNEIRKKISQANEERGIGDSSELRQRLRYYDKQQDGSISTKDFKLALRDYGVILSEETVSHLLKYFSHDLNPISIDYLKFLDEIERK